MSDLPNMFSHAWSNFITIGHKKFSKMLSKGALLFCFIIILMKILKVLRWGPIHWILYLAKSNSRKCWKASNIWLRQGIFISVQNSRDNKDFSESLIKGLKSISDDDLGIKLFSASIRKILFWKGVSPYYRFCALLNVKVVALTDIKKAAKGLKLKRSGSGWHLSRYLWWK